MRPQISAIISLIFIFHLLSSQTHGWSTLEKNINYIVARANKFNRMDFEDRKEALGLCQGQGHCLGIARKLLTKSSPIVSTKNIKIRKDEASMTKDVDKKPDVLDIAGMDYSPAKRKPPIHN